MPNSWPAPEPNQMWFGPWGSGAGGSVSTTGYSYSIENNDGVSIPTSESFLASNSENIGASN